MMLDMKRTFDEIVEAHTDPERAPADPRQPLLPVAVGRASPARRSTWRWRSWASCGPRGRVGPDRRRHPAVPLGAGLPRRARSGSGRFLDGRLIRLLIAPAKAGGRGGMKVAQRRHSACSPARSTKILGAQVLSDVQTFVAALDTMFGGFRSAPTRPTGCSRRRGRRSSWSPRRSGTRCGRRPTSSSGWPRSAMPLAGLVLNRVHRVGRAASCRRHAARPPPSRWRSAATTR